MAQDKIPNNDKLLSLFDKDPFIAEEKLLRLREKLIRFFSREFYLSADDCEDCANETIKRVIEKLNQGLEITSEIESEGIEKYFFGVAKFVKLEFRGQRRYEPIDEGILEGKSSDNPEDELEKKELISFCRQCLAKLNEEEQKLLLGFFDNQPGELLKDARKRFAKFLGIKNVKLNKRAFRVRKKLEACLKKYLDNEEQN
jgi:DNA-directed RNA polymerase specialized sigma24 family protein